MKITVIILLGAALMFTAGCSRENAKRMSYEAVRNMEQQECLKDRSIDCPDRESYNDYQRKREEATSSESR